jgi:hypothetical protein
MKDTVSPELIIKFFEKYVVDPFVEIKENAKGEILQNISPEYDEIKYNFNTVLKLMITNIDNVMKHVHKIILDDLSSKMSKKNISKELYEKMSKSLDTIILSKLEKKHKLTNNRPIQPR